MYLFKEGCGPLMYAFHVKEIVSDEMMDLLIPEQSRNDPTFWETKDQRGGSLLLFAIWNPKSHCAVRLKTLKRYMPEESFQKLIQERKPLLYAFYFQERVDNELMRLLISSERDSDASFWRGKDQVEIFLFKLTFFFFFKFIFLIDSNRNSLIQIAILNKRPECLQRLTTLKSHMQRDHWLELLQNKNAVKTCDICFKFIIYEGQDAWELTKKIYADELDTAKEILNFLTKSL
ncbi:hypothetical protein RFI_20565 [Reticulomyxa filosa]|uniref:Uncharacterized protein n=1 Tax=Reticulomyxa filosa TaxID=46433 RepID=X6MSE8_RETFI|nr:hypothetical protein RFI_20565 [Reticulomyxa filosa]|eukprot:ETO16774.1 hypothetical protein RFI_20565 [Reticulomyxa filosa]